MRHAPLLYICLSVMVFVSAGCAALTDYSRMTMQARASIDRGNFADALASFPESSARGSNEVLIRMERGALLQAMGEYEKSAHEFELANKKMESFEDRAVVSASRTASELGSLVINEQIQPYEGEDFEKILIHGLDAVNYLMMGDLEGARVEIRNAYTRQKELYEKHARELEKAEKESTAADWKSSFQEADPDGYARLRDKAQSIGGIYQNAFAYYISALVYEMGGEQDEAYIDMKKAIVAAPGSYSIQQDLIRLSRDLHFDDDAEKWESLYGRGVHNEKDAVDVFVIFEVGLAPYKEAVSFPIPLSRGGFVSASMPVYRFIPSSVQAGRVSYNGGELVTSVVSDTDAIAAKNLLDNFFILFVKQVSRSYLKARATNKLSKEYGAVGAVGGTLASILTEQADLRCWSSLPKEIQVARVFVPGKSRSVTIGSVPGRFKKTVEIKEGTKHLIILCRATDVGLTVQTRAY